MAFDPYNIPTDSICFNCKNKERKNSQLTGIGVYCTSYKSERSGMSISGGLGKSSCKGFENE